MKRRGFTLIELMVVIAIIIILAAIAIPNYLTMTARAKKSRLASDMATLATGLETFKTDWSSYPTNSAYEAVNSATTQIYMELSGVPGSGSPTYNKANAINAIGEKNPASWSSTTPFVEYIKAGTMTSITDPFKNAAGGATTHDDGNVYYESDGKTWTLGAWTGDASGAYSYRTDSMSTVSAIATLP